MDQNNLLISASYKYSPSESFWLALTISFIRNSSFTLGSRRSMAADFFSSFAFLPTYVSIQPHLYRQITDILYYNIRVLNSWANKTSTPVLRGCAINILVELVCMHAYLQELSFCSRGRFFFYGQSKHNSPRRGNPRVPKHKASRTWHSFYRWLWLCHVGKHIYGCCSIPHITRGGHHLETKQNGPSFIKMWTMWSIQSLNFKLDTRLAIRPWKTYAANL